jgi:hypothetical protein
LLQYVYPFFYPIDMLLARLNDSGKINAISLRNRICYVVNTDTDTEHIK